MIYLLCAGMRRRCRRSLLVCRCRPPEWWLAHLRQRRWLQRWAGRIPEYHRHCVCFFHEFWECLLDLSSHHPASICAAWPCKKNGRGVDEMRAELPGSKHRSEPSHEHSTETKSGKRGGGGGEGQRWQHVERGKNAGKKMERYVQLALSAGGISRHTVSAGSISKKWHSHSCRGAAAGTGADLHFVRLYRVAANAPVLPHFAPATGRQATALFAWPANGRILAPGPLLPCSCLARTTPPLNPLTTRGASPGRRGAAAAACRCLKARCCVPPSVPPSAVPAAPDHRTAWSGSCGRGQG